MSKNRCVAKKRKIYHLTYPSRSSSCSWFYLTITALSVLEVAGASGQAYESSISKWYRGPWQYEG